ncbi:MAG TPA: four helix bundle protein [Daejeonella sp.]|uniref:four helix bundle protein n=1 Tax=Daejeonella sp. TaxID=2805397 RepID=UPI002EDA1837
MRDFKQLSFWHRSHSLTLKLYLHTKSSFPKDEMYGLISQIRRSGSSIPTNIAEGCGRNSNPDFKRFLVMSTGSCSELEYQLMLSKDLGYLSETVFNELIKEVVEIRKSIYSYIKTL